MAAPAQKQSPTEARLDTLVMPEGATWAREARDAALSRVRAMGLPTKRDEYWRYTDPTSLVQPAPIRAALFDDRDETPVFGGVDRLKIVFVDGVFDAEMSDDLSMAGLEIERLSDALSADIHWARDLYGAGELAGQDPVARPCAALNTAFASDGVVIRATGNASRPVALT